MLLRCLFHNGVCLFAITLYDNDNCTCIICICENILICLFKLNILVTLVYVLIWIDSSHESHCMIYVYEKSTPLCFENQQLCVSEEETRTWHSG